VRVSTKHPVVAAATPKPGTKYVPSYWVVNTYAGLGAGVGVVDVPGVAVGEGVAVGAPPGAGVKLGTVVGVAVGVGPGAYEVTM
jgi:hypothetical protein